MSSDLATTGTDWTNRHEKAKQRFTAESPLRDSLLDVVESQELHMVRTGVQVEVQRVHPLPGRGGIEASRRAAQGMQTYLGPSAALEWALLRRQQGEEPQETAHGLALSAGVAK